jgi:hypothetical protein
MFDKFLNHQNCEIKEFRYLDTTINFLSAEKNAVFDFFTWFFNPFAVIVSKDGCTKDALCGIWIYNFRSFDLNSLKYCRCEGEFCIRRSSAKQFNLEAVIYVCGNYKIYKYKEIDTILIFNKQYNSVICFLSSQSEIAFVEMIRDIIIKNQENHNTLILHAAAVATNDEAYIIAGSKGAGKSTVMLNLLFGSDDFRLMSGDKVFLKISDGRLIASGWPDYPHLGIGTIRMYPKIQSIVGSLTGRNDQEKIILDPKIFYQIDEIRLCSDALPVKKVICPKFDADEAIIVSELDSGVEDIIKNLEFKNDFKITRCHDFIVVQDNKRSRIKKLRQSQIQIKTLQISGNFRNINSIVISGKASLQRC